MGRVQNRVGWVVAKAKTKKWDDTQMAEFRVEHLHVLTMSQWSTTRPRDMY